jgi:hypothetical protein
MSEPSTISFGTDLASDRAKPPAHLSRQAKRWWRSILDAHYLEPHRVAILTAAAEAWDRKEQARLILAEEGIVIRVGDERPMPILRSRWKTSPRCASLIWFAISALTPHRAPRFACPKDPRP